MHRLAALSLKIRSVYKKGETDMLGERIMELRKARHLTQVELAKALSVTKQSVSNWENDNIQPSIEMLIKIAKFFSCTTDYLLELGDERNLIEVSGLTLEQIAHINAITKDLQICNKKAEISHENSCF